MRSQKPKYYLKIQFEFLENCFESNQSHYIPQVFSFILQIMFVTFLPGLFLLCINFYNLKMHGYMYLTDFDPLLNYEVFYKYKI